MFKKKREKIVLIYFYFSFSEYIFLTHINKSLLFKNKRNKKAHYLFIFNILYHNDPDDDDNDEDHHQRK